MAQSSIYKLLQNQDKVKSTPSKGIKSAKSTTEPMLELEKRLVAWIVHTELRNVLVDGTLITERAKQFALEN